MKYQLRSFKNIMRAILISMLVVFLFISLTGCGILSTPTPTANPTLQPSATPPGCLIGIWEIEDPEQFLLASLPVGAFDPASLNFIGNVGSVAYRFDTQGVLTIEAAGFYGRFDVQEGGKLNMLDIRMNGFASGAYRVDGDTVQLTEMLSSDVQYSAIYLEEEMMNEAKADSFFPLFVDPYQIAKFQCSQEKLTLEFANFPNIQEPLGFKRLR